MAEPLQSKNNRDWGITDYYFIDLVVMLASSVKIDLGEIPHPYYKDKDLNLARARITINMITSLVKKTSGNLNIEEKKVLREVLEDLQKAYVDITRETARTASPNPSKNPVSRPLIPNPPSASHGPPDVKDWIHMVQQEIAKKKQSPPSPK
jgi:hypothetical protein